MHLRVLQRMGAGHRSIEPVEEVPMGTEDKLSEGDSTPLTTVEDTGTPPTAQDLENYPDIVESMNLTLIWQVHYKGLSELK